MDGSAWIFVVGGLGLIAAIVAILGVEKLPQWQRAALSMSGIGLILAALVLL